ncbi:MAG: methyltransferase [Candidatus Pelagibacter sp. TMED64]|nr:MAG: methyltransferase [Candidatus Pelagibacter sp. TMED64]
MMTKDSITLNSCQISKAKDLKQIVFLGYVPPVNKLKKIGSLYKEEKLYPLELFYSNSSKLVQISTIVNKEILFPKEYPYTSSTTKILRKNFKELYDECTKIINLTNNDLIIDIGSNDGNLLSNFKKKHKVLGITPEKIGHIAIKKGINTIIKYFDNRTTSSVLKKFSKAKIITATNVFAHIDNVKNVIRNILKLLKNDGVFISESHYLVPLIKTVQYDTIYHEHLRYYSLTSLKKLFDKFNLEIIHAKEIEPHGGSIRVYAARKGFYKVKKSVKKILQYEKKFLNKKTFNKFNKTIVNSKVNLFSLISKIKKDNKKIYGIGAPSRSSTLINYVGLNEQIIDCVLEIDGSYKIGHYIPGTKIPILNEKILYKDQPEYVILFSWHIKDELKKNLKKRGFKGKFIIPLPYPKIEN